MAREKKAPKRKERKNIAAGVAHVNSSFNNTKILISDVQGNAIAWSSSGTMGFKGSRKSTPYAAQMAAEDVGKKAQDHGVKTLEVVLVKVEILHLKDYKNLDSKLKILRILLQYLTTVVVLAKDAVCKSIL